MSKIIIALGGNALGNNPEEQLERLESVAKILVNLVKDGNQIVLTHGNGPQVGQIVLAMEYASESNKTPYMPFPECGSMSQGYIGYQLQQCIQDELERQNIKKNCVTLITQVLVDAKDEAFQNPTKPIGKFYTKEEALKMEKEGLTFVEDSGRGYRRVVPSPIPINIIESDVIKQLVENDNIVIAVGGGGIPVVKTNKIELLEGIEAVIDKDRSSALLGREINADTLLILTSIEGVYTNFNTPEQKLLSTLTVENSKNLIKEGHFAKGSMLPKIEACIEFIGESDQRTAIICSLEKAGDALKGKTGTKIKRRF